MTRALYTKKNIIHYNGKEPTFLNMQEIKILCSHEPVLKKLLEDEIFPYTRDKWEITARHRGQHGDHQRERGYGGDKW